MPVVVDIKLKLKKPKKKKLKPKINFKMLNDQRIQSLYSIAVRNKYDGILNVEEGSEAEELGSEEQFGAFRDAMEYANREVLFYVNLSMYTSRGRRPWVKGYNKCSSSSSSSSSI